MLACLAALLLSACTRVPDGIRPVEDFRLERYLGTWYEIARLDHSFERGLTRVTAEYTLSDDGSIRVVNRGYDPVDDQWRTAEGVARFVGRSDEGHLKVSFFGPFYGSYVVFGLDRDNYSHAFVTGYNRDYLWLLSRSPVANAELLRRFRQRAESLGFDLSGLVLVEQERNKLD